MVYLVAVLLVVFALADFGVFLLLHGRLKKVETFIKDAKAKAEALPLFRSITPMLLFCLFVGMAVTPANAQFKPIGHALRVAFDVKPVNRYQAAFETARWYGAGWDWKTTVHFVKHTPCTETFPGMGPKPSTARLLGTAIPIELGLSRLDTWIQKRMQREHWPKADRIAATAFPNLAVGFGHAFAAYNNACPNHY